MSAAPAHRAERWRSVTRLWLHSPLGHSVAKIDADSKEHIALVQKVLRQADTLALGFDLAQPGAFDASVEAGVEARAALFQQYGAEALVVAEEKVEELQARRQGGSEARTRKATQQRQQQRDAARQDRIEAKRASMPTPTEAQHRRLAQYAAITAAKHRQFLANVLSEQAEAADQAAPEPGHSAQPAAMHTLKVEQTNAIFTDLNKRQVNTSEEVHRCVARMRMEVGAFGSEPSGAAFGWGSPPPWMPAWMLDVHHMYCRNLSAAQPKKADHAAAARKERIAAEEAEVKRQREHQATLLRRATETCEAEGGFVPSPECEDGRCPLAPQGEDIARLEELLDALFGMDDSLECDAIDAALRGQADSSVNPEAFGASEAAELVRIITATLCDKNESYAQWAADFEKQGANVLDRGDILESLNESYEAGSAAGWPTQCAECGKGVPCRRRRIVADEQLTAKSFAGVDVTIAALGWTTSAIVQQIRKRNLLRRRRTATSFELLTAAHVWNVWPEERRPKPGDTDAALPTAFANKAEAALTLGKILMAEATDGYEAWDFASVDARADDEGDGAADSVGAAALMEEPNAHALVAAAGGAPTV